MPSFEQGRGRAQRNSVLRLLEGGDLRSIGRAEEAARRVLAAPSLFKPIILGMWDPNPVVRARAADAAEKITRTKPGWLAPFKTDLLQLAEKTTQKELQWHLAQMIPRLPLTPAERRRSIKALQAYIELESSIVRTCALQGLFELAPKNRAVIESIGRASRSGSAAERTRARRLLASVKMNRNREI